MLPILFKICNKLDGSAIIADIVNFLIHDNFHDFCFSSTNLNSSNLITYDNLSNQFYELQLWSDLC